MNKFDSEIKFPERSKINSIKVIKAIQIDSFVGEGTNESPIRSITEYFDLKGNLLAKGDVE